MHNINKPRFLSSVFLLTLITGLVYFNQPASAALFAQTQLLLSEYLGWFIILVANGFLIFTIYLTFTRAELVSVFTYYCHIGYLAESGGKVRATNGTDNITSLNFVYSNSICSFKFK